MQFSLDQFLPAFLGLIAGAVGSLIAPWVNWGIEKRKQRLAYRRELIAKWRQMVRRVALALDQNTSLRDPSEGFTPAELLEREEEFYSLKPHLSKQTQGTIYANFTVVAGSTVSAPIAYMIDDIADIERKWKLV